MYIRNNWSLTSAIKIITLIFLGYVFQVATIYADECNIEALKNLRNLSIVSLKKVRNAFDVDIDHTTYYQGEKVKIFDVVVPGEYGYQKIRYWLLSYTSYLVEYRKFWYEEIVDPSKPIKISQASGGMFYICNKKLLKIDKLPNLKVTKYLAEELDFINQVLEETIIKGSKIKK